MKYININDANQNFVLEEDILNDKGSTILKKGTRLNDRIIDMLRQTDNFIIAVSEAEPEEPKKTSDVSNNFSREKEFITNHLKSSIENMKLLGKDAFAPIRPAALFYVDEIVKEDKAVELLYQMSKLDGYTMRHSIGVALVSALISFWEELKKSEMRSLFIAGLFSQVGKLGVPKDLILKTDPLTADELKVIKSYTLNSSEYLKDLSFINEDISLAILQSTEKLNGTGFPYGLKGEQISYMAQIVGVANIFDAAINNKCYKSAASPFKIATELFQDSLELLSPNATIPLIKAIESSFLGMKVELSNGEVGEIVFMNKLDPNRPLVQVGDKIYDLSMGREKLNIERMLY